MNELMKDVLEFANQNPSSWLATCEENQPRVRGMLLWFADETGFYYHTAQTKSLYSQLMKNPKMEVGFIRNADKPEFEMLRVAGTAEIVEDEDLVNRLKEERAWLWGNIERAKSDSKVAIFRIANASAYIWSMKWNLREEEIPRVQF